MKMKRCSRRKKNGHFVVPHIHMHINYCIHNRYIYCNIATYQECALYSLAKQTTTKAK